MSTTTAIVSPENKSIYDKIKDFVKSYKYSTTIVIVIIIVILIASIIGELFFLGLKIIGIIILISLIYPTLKISSIIK